MTVDRIVTGVAASPNEEAVERALRPQRLADYVGQARIREQLDIFITAARNRREALDHVLLFGPPGLGKTATGAKRSTTCCCSARRGWARPRWRTSSRTRWA